MVKVGLEVFAQDARRWAPSGARVGLLSNLASVDANFRTAREVAHRALGCDLAALFGPQHGLHSDVQDNMVESPHGRDPRLGIPVWSLYAETRTPTPAMLEGLDVLLVDLQDVGTRVYTYVWTLRLALEACGRAGVRVVVLDRPNPLGRAVEGNVLRPEWTSFVGLEPIPMRHGLTLGEMARWFQGERGVECEVEVVPAEGWTGEPWQETGRPWVLPSPNMPTFETALVYPGTVLFEGTTASEGRGTTRPFEILGLPGLDGEALAEFLGRFELPGAFFRPIVFQPTFQKWAGRTCGGVFVHVGDAGSFRPYRTGLALLAGFWQLGRGAGFDWRPPPYEYEADRLPIHLLLGDSRVREAVEAGDPSSLEASWAPELEAWRRETAPYLLYPRHER